MAVVFTRTLPKSAVADSMTYPSLQALFHKRIYAIVVPKFLDQKICKLASQKLLRANLIKEYTNAVGIGRVGVSFFETTDNPEMEREYFDTALQNIESLRKVFHPFSSPIDMMRLLLDERWPSGANLATREGKKMFAGLIRALEPSKGILPHEDKFERDAKEENSSRTVISQIAGNIYLQPPEKGGALELYEESLTTEKYDALRGESYGIDRALLPLPAVVITPRTGDLVLFNSRNLHAVTDSEGKASRISIAFFAGYSGDNVPLKIWS